MIRSIINNAVKAALDELFVNTPSVQLSMGADLFSDSKINLSNLTFRPDIFDLNIQPLTLVHGHLGSLNVEGIAELALGGKLRFNADNLYLLFAVDEIADPEKLQTMKKILLELQSGQFSQLLLWELMRKLQGLSNAPEVDVLQKRKVLYKMIDYVTKGIFCTIKNVHIRIEVRCRDALAQPRTATTESRNPQHAEINDIVHDIFSASVSSQLCNAVGIMIPFLKFVPAPIALRPEGVSKNDPVVLVSGKALQAYCDYQRESYGRESPQKIVECFSAKWKHEVHSAMISPMDVDLVLGLAIKRRAGLMCPTVNLHIPTLKFVIDERQVAVLSQIAFELTHASKRFAHAVRIQKIFRNGFPLPRVQEVGGLRLLPHLMLQNKAYPSQFSTLPASSYGSLNNSSTHNSLHGGRSTQGSSQLVAFMKDRVGARWPVMMWKHVIRIVISDLQQTRPLGRWIALARIAAMRKEYAFLYAQFFNRKLQTPNGSPDNQYLQFNPHQSSLNATKLRQLFEIEMSLTAEAVAMFRSLGYMVAVAASLYNKKKAAAASAAAGHGNSSGNQPGWERVFIGWKEIVHIYTELFEAQRESAFRRFDRSARDAEDLDDSASFWDAESVAGRSVDEGVYSFSMQRPASNKLAITPTKRGVLNESPSARSSAGNSTATSNAAKKLFSVFNFSNITSAFTPKDEYDRKILGKFDLSAFGDKMTSLVENTSGMKFEKELEPSVSPEVEASLKRGPNSQRALCPDIALIADAVQWTLLKHQDVVTFLPPDVFFKLDKMHLELKSPATLLHRERVPIASMSFVDINTTVNISQSSNNNSPSQKRSAIDGTPLQSSQAADKVKSLRGFASLSGALIQFRMVCRSMSVSLRLLSDVDPSHPSQQQGQPGDAKLMTMPAELAGSLPAYPLSLKREAGSGDSLHSASSDGDEFDENSEGNAPMEAGEHHSEKSQSSLAKKPGNVFTEEDSDHSNNELDSIFDQNIKQSSILQQSLQKTSKSMKELPVTSNSTADADVPKQAKSVKGLTTSLKYLPGETVLQSMQRMQQERDAEDEKLRVEDEEKEREMRKSKAVKTGEFTIDSRFDDSVSVVGKPAVVNGKTVNFGSKMTAEGAFHPRDDMKDVLSSAPADNALVFCLILDLDDKGDGAGDVQVQVGGMRLDLSKRILATLMHESFASHVSGLLRHKQDMDTVLALRKDNYVLMDWEQLLPVVVLSCDPPVSVLDELLLREESARYQGNANSSSSSRRPEDRQRSKKVSRHRTARELLQDIDQQSHDGSEEDEASVLIDDSQVSIRAAQQKLRAAYELSVDAEGEGDNSEDGNQREDLLERRARRAAIAFNKNIMQWLGVLETSLPKVLSFCIRSSPVVVQSLESAVIRDLVYAKLQSVIDSASSRRKDHGINELLPMHHVWGLLTHLVMSGLDNKEEVVEFNNRVSAYRRMRRWGARASNPTITAARRLQFNAGNAPGPGYNPAPQSAFKIKMLVPALELMIAKAVVPYPSVDVHLQGINVLKLPMSDETLCYYLAWMLAEFMPIYF